MYFQEELPKCRNCFLLFFTPIDECPNCQCGFETIKINKWDSSVKLTIEGVEATPPPRLPRLQKAIERPLPSTVNPSTINKENDENRNPAEVEIIENENYKKPEKVENVEITEELNAEENERLVAFAEIMLGEVAFIEEDDGLPVKDYLLEETAKPKPIPRDYTEDTEEEVNTKIPCLKWKNGCRERVELKDMSTHLVQTCEYRPVMCFLFRQNDCNIGECDLDNFFNHLLFDHEKDVWCEDDFNGRYIDKAHVLRMKHRKSNMDITLKRFDGHLFIQHEIVMWDTLFFWVSVIGRKNISSKYTVHVEPSPYKEGIDPAIIKSAFPWELPVVPLHESQFYKVHQEVGNFASILCKYLDRNYDPDGYFKYTFNDGIQIRRVNNEL